MTTVGSEREVRKNDIILVALTMLLTTVGILLVFDASYAYAINNAHSQTKYVGQQAVWAVIGVIVMLAVSRYPYWKLRRWAGVGVFGCIIALTLVLIPHIGAQINGAHRWLGYGVFRIQPSEFAKLFVVVFIARSCSSKKPIMKDYLKGPGPGLLVTCILACLTAMQPDLGTAIIIGATGLATLFFAGMKIKHLTATLAAALVLVGGTLSVKLLHSHGGYQIKRIQAYLNPESDVEGYSYQIYHSMMGIASGGLIGRGVGQGLEKLNLPEVHTDFIFSVVGEEGGLIGSVALLALLFCIAGRGMHIACATNDRFGQLAAAGISFGIAFQAFANIGVATGFIPATGVPLPFISYGGSSLLLSLAMVGILLNIGKNPDGDPNVLNEADDKAEEDFNRRRPIGRPLRHVLTSNPSAPYSTSSTGQTR